MRSLNCKYLGYEVGDLFYHHTLHASCAPFRFVRLLFDDATSMPLFIKPENFDDALASRGGIYQLRERYDVRWVHVGRLAKIPLVTPEEIAVALMLYPEVGEFIKNET